MVDDILKAIDEKAEEEIIKILKEKDEEILLLERDCSQRIAAKQKEQNDLALKMAEREIEDFEKKQQTNLNFRIQEEKNAIVKEIYSQAQKKLSFLEEHDFKKLIKILANHLSKNKKGRIVAGKRTAKILKDLANSEIKVEDVLNEEGFIFLGDDIEIDFRISQILFQQQEIANPEIIKMIFA